jgi:hypothetical protein
MALFVIALGLMAFVPYLDRLAALAAVTGALLTALALAGNLPAARERFLSAPARRGLRGAARLLFSLAVLCAAGALTSLPVFNMAAPDEAFLPEETLELLRRLDREVTMTAHVSSDPRVEGPVRHLLGLYARATPWVSVSVMPAQGAAAVSEDGELALATQNSVTVSADGFEETVIPPSRAQLDAAIRRLVTPPRLVYCLMGEGSKSAADSGPQGLSVWARHLARRKIYLRDWEWTPGRPLPREAHALVYAGPRMPPDPEKESDLLDYLARGGKLMSLNDPMMAALDPGLFSPLNLRLPEGLVVDMTKTWAGTDNSFIISEDFPAHPATLGMREPVIFPIAGAVFSAETKTAGPEDTGEQEAAAEVIGDSAGGTEGADGTEGPDGTALAGGAEGADGADGADGTEGEDGTEGPDGTALAGGAEGADGAAVSDGAESADNALNYGNNVTRREEGGTHEVSAGTEAKQPETDGTEVSLAEAAGTEAPGTDGSGTGGMTDATGNHPDDAEASENDPFVGHTWAVALTSEMAFLETDRASIGRRDARFSRDSDVSGPLALASATTLANGGRLVLAADSDFPSNAYIGFAGNMDFATGLLSWLVGAEDDLKGPRRGTVLTVTDSLARLFFWGPVVFWPLMALSVWGWFFFRRRRAAA